MSIDNIAHLIFGIGISEEEYQRVFADKEDMDNEEFEDKKYYEKKNSRKRNISICSIGNSFTGFFEYVIGPEHGGVYYDKLSFESYSLDCIEIGCSIEDYTRDLKEYCDIMGIEYREPKWYLGVSVC
jgi:hypothetical protein